jgi:hypothetical protein
MAKGRIKPSRDDRASYLISSKESRRRGKRSFATAKKKGKKKSKGK